MASTNVARKRGRRTRVEHTERTPMSHSELHRRSGVSLAHVSKIYGGRRWPSLKTAAKIAVARGESIDDVYRDVAAAHGVEAVL